MLYLIGFIATIVGANVALAEYGIVPIGFGSLRLRACTSPGSPSRCVTVCESVWDCEERP